MPITSKYSDEHVESILTENVAAAQRKVIAEKFAQALVSSLQS